MASTFKRLYSAVEVAEMIMNDWSDDGDNVADLFMLPPEKVDAMTDDPEMLTEINWAQLCLEMLLVRLKFTQILLMLLMTSSIQQANCRK